jgi:hypothetical protein
MPRPVSWRIAEIRAREIEVAHLAWPVNHHSPGLLAVLRALPVVVYVGSNTSGNSCGTNALFAHFRERDVLAYVPERRNTLIVYGLRLPEPRAMVHWEEHPSLFDDGVIHFSDSRQLFDVARKLP